MNLEPHKEDNLMDYSLPKAPATMATVEEVMQLFESGGKVRDFGGRFRFLYNGRRGLEHRWESSG